ncbi:uncharacterized protein BJ212DRAFT_1386774 [Suillus subaureus]|uniref:Uncharacterized protein n=1 Tax=Suillus subaureus TaxID=48587 RepID=A0A9P7J862_9AGAM|nr:uncharacterized protein BJ212DRAFT_1386774 [Suillus subaureus]KAG1807451.1 hypothetical protein BJ212DRAFT_1386774 [Suillus subaureus]
MCTLHLSRARGRDGVRLLQDFDKNLLSAILSSSTSLFGTIVGFSLFGLALAAHFGQLGIKKRNLLQSECPHSPQHSLCHSYDTDTDVVSRPRRTCIVNGYAGHTCGTNVQRLCLRRGVR